MLITGGLGIPGTRKEPSTLRHAFVSGTLLDENKWYLASFVIGYVLYLDWK